MSKHTHRLHKRTISRKATVPKAKQAVIPLPSGIDVRLLPPKDDGGPAVGFVLIGQRGGDLVTLAVDVRDATALYRELGEVIADITGSREHI